jgi:sugar (pentulose or hexulose) kinase
MSKIPVIAIIDVGKTNKKLFLFDEHYKMVYQKSAKFTETVDEDGDACENLESLRLFVYDSLHEVFRHPGFEVKAINVSTYGASFVYIDHEGCSMPPLYNYLKPFPEKLQKQFYDSYGGEEAFSKETASPVLGSLNSGMQLYRLKYEKPEFFKKIKYALHLPQYISYLISGNVSTDLTSIGCHTNLWNFEKNEYHEWVHKEGLFEKFATILPANHVTPAIFPGSNFEVGIGLHDSSAALIPYQVSFHDPFVLISTGTWCISLNPFNNDPLTRGELENDCLCYMHYQGKPVKASRIFAGQEHENQVKRIADHFNQNPVRYRNMEFDPEIISRLSKIRSPENKQVKMLMKNSAFGQRDLSEFDTDTDAYHQLIHDIVEQQYLSTTLVLQGSATKRLFVDGGFSNNAIYMNLLASSFPDVEVFAASMAQATSIGTALTIHNSWNKKQLPGDLIVLKYYSANHEMVL